MNPHRPTLLLAIILLVVLALPAQSSATFPGVNGKIAFERDDGGRGLALYVMNSDGTGQKELFHDFAIDLDSKISWSADGKQLAFAGFGHIYIADPDGGHLTQLTSGPGGDSDPAWSPDGKEIAFERDNNLFKVNVATHDIIRLTDGTDFDFAWSPDGQRIAFASYHGVPVCCRYDIFSVNADGSDRRNLTDGFGDYVRHPDWSPDGKKIAFAEGFFNVNVWVMNADGTGQTELTRDSHGDWDSEPSWSPDGNKIAFISTRAPTPNFGLWVMNADGSHPIRLTDTPQEEFNPAWQPLVRSSFKNAAQFCKAVRESSGEGAFRQTYGNSANVYGKCVGHSH